MPAKAAATKKAAPKDAKRATKVVKVTTRKAYTRPQFRRPHTYRHAPLARPANTVRAVTDKKDAFSIIRYPLHTEKAMKKIEDNNTLTFIVDPRSNKTEIKKALRKLHNVKAVKVNTLIRPDGLKKAYVRLAAGTEALDVASRIGII